ncbi:uncharacterized protein DS421_14g462610 [Arachis hypogaea]|nr:uncharacterized protein DS421_14g462610 [Arachis hypogaea]
MVAKKPFCHRSCPETPSESDSAAAGVLRPPEPPPEVLATSAVAGNIFVDPPEFPAAAGVVAAADSKSQLLRFASSVSIYVSKSLALVFCCVRLMNMSFDNVGSSPDYCMLRLVLLWYCERGWELKFWLPSVRVEAERTL